MAHGDVMFLGFFTAGGWEFSDAVLMLLLLFPIVDCTLFPLNGDGLSSFDFLLFSGRGAEKVVGDVEGVFVTAFVDMLILDTDEFLDALPLGPPFLSLLCTYNVM